MDGSPRSPGGGIQVRTTERGLPIALARPAQVLKPPRRLGSDPFAVPALSQTHAGRTAPYFDCPRFQPHRHPCFESQHQEELAQAEAQLHDDPDGAPDIWMRPV